MGRAASHITLECALQTHPNAALIGEEVGISHMQSSFYMELAWLNWMFPPLSSQIRYIQWHKKVSVIVNVEVSIFYV